MGKNCKHVFMIKNHYFRNFYFALWYAMQQKFPEEITYSLSNLLHLDQIQTVKVCLLVWVLLWRYEHRMPSYLMISFNFHGVIGPVLKIKDRGNHGHGQGTKTFWEDQQKVDNVNFFLFLTGSSNKCDFGRGAIIDFKE